MAFQEMNVSTQTCIITGASRGIGLATAVRFARRGFNVVAVARSAPALAETAEKVAAAGGRCHVLAADLTHTEGARECVDATMRIFGRLDVVVNNAGVAPLSSIPDMSDAAFAECIELNCGSVFRLTRAAWKALASSRGTIVNVSSIASTDPFPGFSVYGACKAWVNTFTRAAAEEGRALGIRVIGIAPGAVETGMLRQHFPDFPKEQTLEPDDVAAAIEAVTTDPFRYATGQTVFIRR